MIINYPTNWKCPLCDCKNDYVLFGFTAHSMKNKFNLGNNPSDFSALILCPNLHIFGLDRNGNILTIEEHDDR